jgi:hypothetical protein
MSTEESRPCAGAASTVTAATIDRLAREDDVYAWGGIILLDGRVISLAWLYGWDGAVASPARPVCRG